MTIQDIQSSYEDFVQSTKKKEAHFVENIKSICLKAASEGKVSVNFAEHELSDNIVKQLSDFGFIVKYHPSRYFKWMSKYTVEGWT